MTTHGQIPNRSALILYGSETGNAQDVAEELGRLTERLYFTPTVVELDSASVSQLLHYTIVLFAISTTGQGDMPANSRKFWKSLRSVRLRPGCLGDVYFASFGLGDSSYPKYNWAHRKLYSRIIQLGAHALCERGEADEQHPEGIDGLFLPWSSKLRESLLELRPLPEGVDPIPNNVFLHPKWSLRQVHEGAVNGHTTSGEPNLAGKDSNLDNEFLQSESILPPQDLLPFPGTMTAQLVGNSRVTPENHWQDVRQFTFNITEPVQYTAGDVVTIYPKNFPEDVESLIELMNWSEVADSPIEFTPTAPGVDLSNYPSSPLPHVLTYPKLTLRSILLNYLDITAIARRSFFAAIAHFTDDETQRERLEEFTDPELVDELYDYTSRPRRSILEVLQEFYTVKIPWEWVASIIPVIRGRQFSIASGGHLKVSDSGYGSIELLVAIVKYRTVIKKIRQGLCTRYLAVLRPGTKLNILVSKGGLSIPTNAPLLMIGPGTGVAPLRSMLYDRLEYLGVNASSATEHVLFFGGRNRAADYFFEHEWEVLQKQLNLNVFTAFSRDQVTKHYVQDEIRAQAQSVYRVLQSGVVIICGSSGKMPQAVREALMAVIQSEAKLERSDAETFLVQMEKTGRYQQETW